MPDGPFFEWPAELEICFVCGLVHRWPDRHIPASMHSGGAHFHPAALMGAAPRGIDATICASCCTGGTPTILRGRELWNFWAAQRALTIHRADTYDQLHFSANSTLQRAICDACPSFVNCASAVAALPAWYHFHAGKWQFRTFTMPRI